MKPYPESVQEQARRWAAEGVPLKEISRRLGCAKNTVHRWVNPVYAEHNRAASRAVKERYRGTCQGCGASTNGGGGPGTASDWCWHCWFKSPAGQAERMRRTIWTRESIIAAIREWAAEHDGEPPACDDWNPTAARTELADEWRALRFENDPRWPHMTSVVQKFGRWNLAIEAAGFTPRVPSGGGGNMRRRRDVRAKEAG